MRLPLLARGALAAPARILLSNPGHIYLADYDGAGFATTLNHSLPGATPSWLAFAEPNLLYAVDEASANTLLFHLDLDTNTLTQVASQPATSGAVHLEFNRDRTRMVGAGYGGGAVDVWNVEGGGLELVKTISSDDALGPDPERQAAPHPHGSALDPTGRFFAVQDLGTDTILVIDARDDDALDVVNHVRVEPAGAGPRHGAFYPAGGAGGSGEATHYVVLCELQNLLVVYALEYGTAEGLRFTHQQTVSSFGPGGAPEGAGAGELAIAADGGHVYASNRLTGGASDSIAHFAVGEGARLTYVGSTPTGGTNPRMFSIAAGGRALLVGNQQGDVGAAALPLSEDGRLDGEPRGVLDGAAFGADGDGPQFIRQIA